MTTFKEPPEELSPEQRLLQNAIEMLLEHFENVHVFANRYDANDDGNTLSIDRGQGNYHARYGLVKHWLISQEEHVRLEARDDHDD